MDGTWTTPGLMLVSVGHTEHIEEFDHGMVWVDFKECEVFGCDESKSLPITGRRCVLGQVKLVNKHSVNLKNLCKSMNMKGRLELAAKKFEDDPEDKELWKEIDKLDQERKNAC